MKVSFILPAYKRRFLKEAIDSILAQTCRDFELVVVDDASPENLEEIVGGFADSRLSYHRNSENIGGKDLVAAWQKALGYAKGEWIVLASDDDLYARQFLERMVSLAEKYPHVDLVHSRVKIVDADGKIIRVSPVKPELESAIELLHDRVVRKADQFVPEFMFRRSRLDDIGGFVNFPKAWYSDDATWTLMASNGCANCNEVLFAFRSSGINISTSYGDIFDLVESGRQFFSWARRFLDGVAPKDEVEVFLVGETDRNLEARVLEVIKRQVAKTSWTERLNVLWNGKISPAWKLRCLLEIFRSMIRR